MDLTHAASPLLLVSEAAAYARTSTKTIYRALESHELTGSQRATGGTWRIRQAALDEWIASRETRPVASRRNLRAVAA